MNAIVVVVDGLGASHLGPYGNSWLETPHFNRLAAESILLDCMYADSVELPDVYRSYMSGQHAFSKTADNSYLLRHLQQQNIDAILVSDSREVLQLPESAEFSQRISLPVNAPQTPADVDGATQIARVFLETLDQATVAKNPYLLWVHCTGMNEVWDAPMANRFQFADPDDPEPSNTVVPPCLSLPTDFDPDEVLPYILAHAAQVDVVDTCLGMLLDSLDHLPDAEKTLLIVTSPRGYPLGEHRHIGHGGSLYSELLHVPCLLRYPQSPLALRRSSQLAQPSDLCATLLDWFKISPPDELWGRSIPSLLNADKKSAQEFAAAATPNESLLITKAWLWRQNDNSAMAELFTKPDDRWEVNEVANRCPEIVEKMRTAFEQFRAAAETNRRSDLPVITEELYDIFR